ncbi:acylphosphatase-1 isoform X1 [Xenopus laevis]|uniref:Acylphosphatase n=1 Tax=Xenopus laevis TaxID=8355 RepID=A0A8J1MWZ0_XENLA|nr:acylphosphatase-1 isoform X1 [Xenopus laevis]
MSSSGFWSVDYEIYGDVQGVFFRKYTEDQAKRVNAVGWVKNAPRGTVVGQVQGSKSIVEIMYAGSDWAGGAQISVSGLRTCGRVGRAWAPQSNPAGKTGYRMLGAQCLVLTRPFSPTSVKFRL